MKGWGRAECGTVPSVTRCALLVQRFSGDLTVEDFGCEPARLPVPSRPPGTPPRRLPASAERSFVGRPTGLGEPAGRPKPEAACEWAPDALIAGSPCSGRERPSSLAVGPKREPLRRGRTESPTPALS